MCEGRKVKGVVMMVGLSELVHSIAELWEVGRGLESRTDVTISAIAYMPFSLCRTMRTPRMTGRAVWKGRAQCRQLV